MNINVFTFILFMFISLLVAFLLFLAQKRQNEWFVKDKKVNYYYIFIVILLTILAFGRRIDEGIGGADMINYIYHFQSQDLAFWYSKGEWLFCFINQIIGSFTTDYRIYFLFVYLFIAISFILFIKSYSQQNQSYIPFITFFYLYLLSFNTLRTSCAVAMFLLGLVAFKNHKILASILIISSVFIHRISIILVLIIPFYYFYKQFLRDLPNYKLALFIIIGIIMIGLLVYSCKDLLQSSNLLSDGDKEYIDETETRTIMNVINMCLTNLMLFIPFILLDPWVKATKEYDLIKCFCIFSFILILPATILGVWRINEYLYIPRLIMWGVLLNTYEDKYLFNKNSKIIFKFFVFLAFTVYTAYRLYRAGDTTGFMIYEWGLF